MKTKRYLIIGALLLSSCLTVTAYRVQTIPACDKCFRYEGRIDFNDPNSPVIVWQASRISIDFEGDTLTLLFNGAKAQNFFDAKIDNAITIVEANEGMPTKDATFTGLGKGRHHLLLSKRSEGNAGSVHFNGIQIDDEAKVWASAPVAYKLKMEFFGDSKTVGACNEDDGNDQWDTRRTHNGLLSYAAMTAEAFNADHRNVSVSGMGVITGYVDVNVGQMWNKIHPKASSPLADMKSWVPDVAFVNLGENDDSFTKKENKPFPSDFNDQYVSLVRNIRGAYPKAHIVLLRGGMYGGMHSSELDAAWKDNVAQLEANDKNISHYVLKYQAMNHPRVAEDRKLADELIDWLKQQDFMKSYEKRDLSSYFGNYSGAFVLLDASQDKWLRYHPDLCSKRMSPCSTFKIPNSLIALETGVADGPEFSLKWDGTRHPIESWNHDQTLRSAFSVSCVWYYQEITKRIGSERMDEFINKIGYGNRDISGGITNFWLSSTLAISPDEQVEFLRRLHNRKLPFSARTVETVLDIMTVSRQGDTIYRGKTGTAGDPVKGVATQGWWVGSVCSPKGDYYFATCITEGDNPSGRTARKITEAILIDLKILPRECAA
jgi:beta-lactamase class D/lysophospholipase L1-like esterase